MAEDGLNVLSVQYERVKSVSNEAVSPANSLQKTIYNAFQAVKPLVGAETCSEEDTRQIPSLKEQIQAVCSIKERKFPEIGCLTNEIRMSSSQGTSRQKIVFAGEVKNSNTRKKLLSNCKSAVPILLGDGTFYGLSVIGLWGL